MTDEQKKWMLNGARDAISRHCKGVVKTDIPTTSGVQTLTIKEAAKMLNVSVQTARVMIQQNKIPGACCYGEGKRKAYFITDAQIKRVMRGCV